MRTTKLTINGMGVKPELVLEMVKGLVNNMTEDTESGRLRMISSLLEDINETPISKKEEQSGILKDRKVNPITALSIIKGTLSSKMKKKQVYGAITSYCVDTLEFDKARLKREKREAWRAKVEKDLPETQATVLLELIDKWYPNLLEPKQGLYFGDDASNQVGMNISGNVWVFSEYRNIDNGHIDVAMADPTIVPDVGIVDVDKLTIADLNNFCDGFSGANGDYDFYAVCKEYGEGWTEIILEFGFEMDKFPDNFIVPAEK